MININVWHSELSHINFHRMTWLLVSMSLVPKFNLIKGSKCHVCAQLKQTCKARKTMEARNSASLGLVHFDLREMNSELTQCGKQYFMTFIDDCTRFFCVYIKNKI